VSFRFSSIVKCKIIELIENQPQVMVMNLYFYINNTYFHVIIISMNGSVKMDKIYYVTILTVGLGPDRDRTVKENVRLDYQTLDLIIKSERVWFDEKGHSVC